ncbi:CoA ligase [Acrocarpospora pleiomorpha]|uniref:CoA ligase n=1 Tax=Acrocarpospora pleiomorpha TaxID=90975 RepID=A0A5M3XJA7_9ACTN|nr:AMP-binding protein [Acrocarpospora pleiomorpha]GES21547.1 CoA ligase [Acrocarpospora pleiomorpha]
MTATPFSATLWNESERWSRDQLVAHQSDRLRSQLRYVSERSAFYAARFGELDWSPEDVAGLDSLAELPFTRKYDYVESLSAAPPWGSAIAADPESIERIHFSSGTTARPAPLFWTGGDIERWTENYARMYYGQGIRPADVAQVLYTFSWFVGGSAAVQGLQRVGAASIPAGSRDSERQIETMMHYRTTVLPATPSFVFHLLEVADGMGLDLRDSAVRKIVLGGEPGGSVPSTRSRIQDGYGAEVFDTYGSLEFQPIAWECTAHDGMHFAEHSAVVEILDPVTDEPVPDGDPGVVVLTHLHREASPLVRWWTGDVAVRDSSPCACGRTTARLVGGVRGRADDMLVVRGVNLFPSAVEELVRQAEGAAGEYLIVLDETVKDPVSGYLTGIKVRLEARSDAPVDLGSAVAAAIHARLGVRAHVEVVAYGELPRSEHKAKRVVHV